MDDKFELMPSGKIRAVINGEEFVLRLPKLGEFKDLRLWLEDFQAETQKVRQYNLEHALEPDFDPKEVPDQQEGIADFMARAFDALCDKPLPDRDDWPTWMVGDGIINEMIKHWREVPLVRGSR